MNTPHQFHKLLQRQIKKKYGSIENIPEELLPLFDTISKTYKQHDRDSQLLERTMNLSSQELTETNERLSLQTQELERSNKDLQQFAVVVAHDLKEPLRTITSFLQLILRNDKDKFSQDSIEYSEFIINGVSRMADLLDGLLQYSTIGKHHEVQFEAVELNRVLKDVKQNLRFKLNEHQGKIQHGELPVIKGNLSQLTQLFQNLIDNSIKFKYIETPVISISHEPYNRHYHKITVKDNGIGVKEEFVDKIFLIFKRLHHGGTAYKGSGVGLSVCKKIVEHHTGKIWVNTNYTDGFSVSFTLPFLDNTVLK